MTEPLALIFYERIMPGSNLLNRIKDSGYRVQHISDARLLPDCVEREKPLFLVMDLETTGHNVCETIASLKKNPATQHLPIITFAGDDKTELQAASLAAGANFSVGETLIANHLAQLLDQALHIE